MYVTGINRKVSVVMRNRNSGADGRVVGERGGEEKAINTRRPRERGRGVRGNVIEGMRVMGRVKEGKAGFKIRPSRKKGSSGEKGLSRGGVCGTLNKIKVAANKGGDI